MICFMLNLTWCLSLSWYLRTWELGAENRSPIPPSLVCLWINFATLQLSFLWDEGRNNNRSCIKKSQGWSNHSRAIRRVTTVCQALSGRQWTATTPRQSWVLHFSGRMKAVNRCVGDGNLGLTKPNSREGLTLVKGEERLPWRGFSVTLHTQCSKRTSLEKCHSVKV